jgi:hypothetical protein
MENSRYCDSALTEITTPPSSGFFDEATLGRAKKKKFPEKKMGFDPQKGLAMGDEASNLKN